MSTATWRMSFTESAPVSGRLSCRDARNGWAASVAGAGVRLRSRAGVRLRVVRLRAAQRRRETGNLHGPVTVGPVAGATGAIAGAISCAGGARRRRPALLPTGKRIQIHVAIGAGAQPGAAKGGQPFIQCVAEGAEVLVAGIAERQHREAHLIEARRVRTVKLCPERLRRVRGIAVAIGAGDHQQRAGISQRLRRRLGGIDYTRREAARARLFGGLARQRLRGAGLGREHHRQRTGSAPPPTAAARHRRDPPR